MDKDIRRQLTRFGYYSEDLAEIATSYCKKHEGAKEQFLAINDNVHMQHTVYQVILMWQRNRGGINGKTFSEIWDSVRMSNAEFEREKARRRYHHDVMTGRILPDGRPW